MFQSMHLYVAAAMSSIFTFLALIIVTFLVRLCLIVGWKLLKSGYLLLDTKRYSHVILHCCCPDGK